MAEVKKVKKVKDFKDVKDVKDVKDRKPPEVTSQKKRLLARLEALNVERREIKLELKRIDGQEQAEKDLVSLGGGEPTILVYEKGSNVAEYLYSINSKLEKEGIQVYTGGLEYLYTVERTGRDGLDSDHIEWSPLDEDCTCETEEPHGLRFEGEKIPSEIKTFVHVNHFSIKKHQVLDKWEHGTEYQHGHAVSELVGVALASTWKMVTEEHSESDED